MKQALLTLLTLLAALACLPAPAAQAAEGSVTPGVTQALAVDTMAQRMLACAACHGKQGQATRAGYFPRIAGKPAGYLYNQLKSFQEGRRHNAAMDLLLQNLSDAYLHEIADYFASLDLPYPPAAANGLDAAQQQLAQTLVRRGAPERQIPACAACHGTALAGRLPAIPGLLALPAYYLSGQLGAWRMDVRHAAAPDCMADIAKRLKPEEISAISQWLSAQTLPSGTRPETSSAQSLPLRCGSVTP
ncbi:MAG: cytochrome c4 [Paucibacter sp.]|nr:cytochrome c4 [Roseateles sp.]MBV8379953.1 cytochrome c4 [Roseateles sp.]